MYIADLLMSEYLNTESSLSNPDASTMFMLRISCPNFANLIGPEEQCEEHAVGYKRVEDKAHFVSSTSPENVSES